MTTASQKALSMTLDWFQAQTLRGHLTDAQVQAVRARPEWQRHETQCIDLVDRGAPERLVQQACRAWMVWARSIFREIPLDGAGREGKKI